MAREKMDIGAAPPMEDCAQVGRDGYQDRARRECAAYVKLLKRTLGEPPEGARLTVGTNVHDYGTYYSVAVVFDPENAAATDYAFACEGKGPERWDNLALEELGVML